MVIAVVWKTAACIELPGVFRRGNSRNCGGGIFFGSFLTPWALRIFVFALGARPEEVTYMGFLVIAS